LKVSSSYSHMKTTGVDVKSGLGWPDDKEIEIETEPHFNKIRIT